MTKLSLLILVAVARGTVGLQSFDALRTDSDLAKKSAYQLHSGEAAVMQTLVREAQTPTGRPEKNESAAEATGVAENAAGDLNAFVAALITNIVTIIVFFVVGSTLRQRYPLVYYKEAITLKNHPEVEGETDISDDVKKILDEEYGDKCPAHIVNQDWFESYWGWWHASAMVTIDEVVDHRGLDQAMLLEFANTAMKILGAIGFVLVFIMGPCHCFLGEYRAGRPGTADADYLSYWGMANVVDGHPWLYWAHAFVTWFVVVTVQRLIYGAMRDFLKRRNKWLISMPEPRSTTVLVEGIPTRYCRDDKLKTFFNDMFGHSDTVKAAHVVKSTDALLASVSKAKAATQEEEKLKHKISVLKNQDNKKEEIDAAERELATHEAEVAQVKAQAKQERKQVLDGAAKEPVDAGGEEEEAELKWNLTKAFVTFNNRRDAELAKMMMFTPSAEEFVVSIPPDPTDVIYTDLQQDPMRERVSMLVGYALIAGVFWAYLPAVVSIAYFTSLETLAEYFPSMKALAEDEATSALWDGMVNALALQLFIAFVPTFFVLIFSSFFVLKANAWLQHKIQDWYYYFQVIFVLLVTAIGSSLIGTLKELAENPLSIFALLADTMPLATHFYLNYLPLQWVTHAQNLLRLAQLSKFKAFSILFGTAGAIEKSEPEDQDYYGLGSRSARFTFMLTLTLTFCSLSPLITILGFANFWICRKVYGYLVVFCERKKPDLGGVFYVSQLMHVQQGLFIYIVLMTGVLMQRDLSWWPGLIAAAALIFQHRSYTGFKAQFRWESLSFQEIKGIKTPPTSGLSYIQPELVAA